MNKIIAILVLVLSIFASYGQGTVNFNNRFLADGVDAPVYYQTVGGTKLDGTSYLAQLWAAPVASTNFVAIGSSVPFRTGAAAGYVDVGTDASRVIPFVNFGESVQLQIRAWTPTANNYTFSSALSAWAMNPNVYLGISPTLTLQLNSSSLLPPKSLIGLQPFSIVNAVPEPEVFLLSGIGLSVLYVFRRRKS